MANNDGKIVVGLNIPESVRQINADIKNLEKQLEQVKATGALDTSATVKQINAQIASLQAQLKNININANIDTGNIANQAKQVGQQVGNTISQGIQDGVAKANSAMKSFSQLTDSMKSQKVLFDKNGLIDEKNTLDEIKKIYSEFGQVKITNKIFDDGNLQSFKVNIEQVNGDLKETRSFMMQLNGEGTKFIFPDDIVKGTEKYVQHLNEAKNITNATGEALNIQKQRLEEQAKYYGNIKNEINTLYSLKTKLLSADELESAELEKQIKSTKQRIAYNNQQIDKKGLRDNTLTREINDLEVAKQKQLALSEARLQDSANAKSQAQSQKEVNAVLKEQQALSEQVNKIQLSWQTESYQSKVDSLIAKTNQWVDTNGNARISTESLQIALNNLSTAYTNLNSSGGNTVASQQALIEAEKALDVEVKKVQSSVTSMNATMAKSTAVDALRQKVQMFYDTNSKAHWKWGKDLKSIMTQLASGTEVPITKMRQLEQEFIRIQNSARQAGKLGLSFFDTIKQGISKFSYWTSSTFLVMKTFTSIKSAVSSVKELDTALVDLRKTAKMSASELENFYYKSNDVAKQMGVTTKEIITQAAAWSRLGFNTAESATEMAKLSAQFKMISPGMTLDEATDGLVSVMKAYGIEVNDVLDGIMSKINIIGNNKALNNSDIVEFLTRSSAAMASANNSLEETIALGEAAVEITRDASNAGQVLKTTSMRIRGIDEETETYSEDLEILKGKIADLTKTAKTPGGISLFTDETKQTYKSTYQILEEISNIWSDLTDKNQAQLLEVLAGKRNGQALAAIISNFDSARESMDLMANSAGNANAEMAIAMDSIEYKLNKLKETFTGVAQNLFKRDDMKSVIDFFTSIGKAIESVTEKLGLFGSIGIGAGLFAGIKNVGQVKMWTCLIYAYPC